MILEMLWLVHKHHHFDIVNFQVEWPCVVIS